MLSLFIRQDKQSVVPILMVIGILFFTALYYDINQQNNGNYFGSAM